MKKKIIILFWVLCCFAWLLVWASTARNNQLTFFTENSTKLSILDYPAAIHLQKQKKDLVFNHSNCINLNKATVDELDKLPGIGKKMAEKILFYRLEHGNFESLDDLGKVSGIGSKKMKLLIDKLCLE